MGQLTNCDRYQKLKSAVTASQTPQPPHAPFSAEGGEIVELEAGRVTLTPAEQFLCKPEHI